MVLAATDPTGSRGQPQVRLEANVRPRAATGTVRLLHGNPPTAGAGPILAPLRETEGRAKLGRLLTKGASALSLSRGARPAGTRPGGTDRNARSRALQASTEHRNAALATLRPEQLPVAEQLLRGGIPALRRAIDEQNARARTEGRAEVAPESLLAMADELLPKMNLAAWKDRAVAARAADRDCPFRELRAVVAAASTVNVDDEGRELATTLRKSLDRAGHRSSRIVARPHRTCSRRRTDRGRAPGGQPSA